MTNIGMPKFFKYGNQVIDGFDIEAEKVMGINGLIQLNQGVSLNINEKNISGIPAFCQENLLHTLQYKILVKFVKYSFKALEQGYYLSTDSKERQAFLEKMECTKKKISTYFWSFLEKTS